MSKKNKRVRQGHTGWQLVVYPPNAVDGYAGEVAFVYQCFVTRVTAADIAFDNQVGSFVATPEAWAKNFKTFRQAMAEAKRRIAEIDRVKFAEFVAAWTSNTFEVMQ